MSVDVDGEPTDPWVVLKADKGDVVVHALCGPKGATKGLAKTVETVFAGAHTKIQVMHRDQGATESPTSAWRVWIAWRGHARFVSLDAFSVCTHCGQVIVDVGITPEGLILVGH